MDIMTRIARDLLSGKTICDYSDSAGFGMLSDPDGIGEIEKILAPLGVRIAITSGHHAFFAAEASVEEGSRQLKAGNEALAREARRIEDVAEFLLNVFPDGERIRIGQIIETSAILDVVNGSNALIDMLAQLTAGLNMTSNTTSKRLSNLFTRLAKDGYLKSINAEKETYFVTGKVEYVWDVIENFVRLIPDIAEQMPKEEETEQGDLFA